MLAMIAVEATRATHLRRASALLAEFARHTHSPIAITGGMTIESVVSSGEPGMRPKGTVMAVRMKSCSEPNVLNAAYSQVGGDECDSS